MNISNPGPVESWPEVLAQHARDQLTSAMAVKARAAPMQSCPLGPTSSSSPCLEHEVHHQSPLNSRCQWLGAGVCGRLRSMSPRTAQGNALLLLLLLRSFGGGAAAAPSGRRRAPGNGKPCIRKHQRAGAGRRAAGAVPARRDGGAAAAQPGERGPGARGAAAGPGQHRRHRPPRAEHGPVHLHRHDAAGRHVPVRAARPKFPSLCPALAACTWKARRRECPTRAAAS